MKRTGSLEDHFLRAYDEAHKIRLSLNGGHTSLQQLREDAIGSFRDQGFPTRKDEAWKYTSLNRILKEPLVPAPAAAEHPAVEAIGGLDAHRAVFVNGRLSSSQSDLGDLPDGVSVMGLADASPSAVQKHLASLARMQSCPFVALNTAFVTNGAWVHMPAGTVLEKPVHIVHVVTGDGPTLLQPRTLVVADKGAQLRLVESTEVQLSGPTLINSVTEVHVGEGAHVARFEVQDVPGDVTMVTSLDAYQEQGSHFQNNCFTFGKGTVRNNVSMLPDAEQCETLLHGLFIGRGSAHIDNHTLVDHAKPNCFSSENYRGILDDHSTGVFNGKVLVRQDAQQINAYQTNKSVVLAPTARMYAKPELEIYADDVKCSHGATTGQLEEEALFYLRTRGLSMDQARMLMLQAFAGEIIDEVPIEPLRNALDQRVAESLAR